MSAYLRKSREELQCRQREPQCRDPEAVGRPAEGNTGGRRGQRVEGQEGREEREGSLGLGPWGCGEDSEL